MAHSLRHFYGPVATRQCYAALRMRIPLRARPARPATASPRVAAFAGAAAACVAVTLLASPLQDRTV